MHWKNLDYVPHAPLHPGYTCYRAVEDFKITHPNHAELVIEAAIASLDLDRKKAEIYAAAGITEYWIIIPAEKKVEVYSKPMAGKYEIVTIYGENESINTGYGYLDLKTLFG